MPVHSQKGWGIFMVEKEEEVVMVVVVAKEAVGEAAAPSDAHGDG